MFYISSCLWHLILKNVALLECVSDIRGTDMFDCMHADMSAQFDGGIFWPSKVLDDRSVLNLILGRMDD